MATYISILRGINVSGKNIIKMDALHELLSELKFNNVKTYIQSGNVVFDYNATDKKILEVPFAINHLLSKKIASAIEKQFGFAIPVLTLTVDELKTNIEKNPFLKNKKNEVAFMHVTFLADEPQEQLFKAIDAKKYLPDEIQLINKCVYLYCPNGYGSTKLHNTFLEKKLKTSATTRNWKTCLELINIAENTHA